MKVKRIFMFVLVLSILLSQVSMVFGQGVEVNPAYIKGKITLGDYDFSEVVSSAYIYANAPGNYNANVQVNKDGTYTLTVNTPADGSAREYTVYARVSLKSGAQFDAGERKTISTVRGKTYTQDFSQELATLKVEGAFDNDDWRSINLYYGSGSSQYLYYYLYFSSTQSQSFLIPASIPFRWYWGYAYPKDTEKYTTLSLEKKEFTAKPGETVTLSFSGTFPDKIVVERPVGNVRGTISYSPLSEGKLTSHNVEWNYSERTAIAEDGEYSLENVTAGNRRMRVYSRFNNNRQIMYWPNSYINPDNANGNVNLPENEEIEVNVSTKPAIVKGRISLTGSKSLSDVTSGIQMSAYGISGSGSYGGSASDSGIDKNTGEYCLYLTPGIWDVGYYFNYTFSNYSSNLDEYFYSNFRYYDYTRAYRNGGGVELGEEEVVEGYDVEVPTGIVTIKFSSTDDSLIRSPYINASMNNYVDGKLMNSCQVYGTGSSQEVKEAQATIVAPPGTYNVTTSAYVNGSNVTFSPRSVIVIEGVHTVIEINGPTLTLESPAAELYTDDGEVSVKGTATDDAGIESITINGQTVSFESTGNPDDSNEVSFETIMTLEKGPNKLEVEVTDINGKVARDTRYVYRDNSDPTITVTPADGTVTEDTSITLTGTATDDNEITKITVNGLSVDFTPTNNPEDPNEVTFSKAYDLEEGANRFTVTATDNCKRSVTVVNTITNADEDIIPPVIGEVEDLTLELESANGTEYTLTPPTITDDMDPNPTLTNDAPDIFPLGKTVVTWTATDAIGNSSTAIQNVTVVDTTKPELSIPSDITTEATGILTSADIGQATATDIADVDITNDAPGEFPLGTTSVTWIATDANGNSTIGKQSVTIIDTTKPELAIPSDITVEAQSVVTSVYYGKATAIDIFDVTITNDAPVDGKFPLGTTIITWTATDENGNVAVGTQRVTVVGLMMFNEVIHRGTLKVDRIFCNGPIKIYGGCFADQLSTSESSLLITGASNVESILKDQSIQQIPEPDWESLSQKTTLSTNSNLKPNSSISDCRFEESVTLRGTTKITGILVVKGDLTINGNAILDNAAILCTGKITFRGNVSGTGIIYSGDSLANNGNMQINGALIVDGTWISSGSSVIDSSMPENYTEYFIN